MDKINNGVSIQVRERQKELSSDVTQEIINKRIENIIVNFSIKN